MTVIAVIEGDDASPEAVRPVVALLEGMRLGLEWAYPIVGPSAVREHGTPLPEESRAVIDRAAATLFGASSGSTSAVLFYLRWAKQTYANVRPLRSIRGARSPLVRPDAIDVVIVRENLEDMYVCAEGDLTDLGEPTPRSATFRRPVGELGDGRFAMKVITRAGTERVVRYAFELARRRGERHHVTCTAKTNMLPKTDGFFASVAAEVASSYPDVGFDTLIVDDFACRLVQRPEQFDVVVMPNLYGDILSDAGAALVGGLGLAPSGCFGEDYAYFEPAHGTAPDIAGTNTINPTATLLSAAMMLDHVGLASAASSLRSAIAAVYADGRALTPDQGGRATTTEFCDAVSQSL